MVSIMPSICSMISVVNNAAVSMAVKLSFNCASLVAPNIAVLTFGFLIHHAILNDAVLTFNAFARALNWDYLI